MILKKLRYLIEKVFNINIRKVKKNIYKNLETPDIDIITSLSRSSGVLHIGGHRGSERFIYDWFGKEVIWIEANPAIFRELKDNLKEFKYQKCYQALLHSTKGKWLDFFLSSNDQASSSIYDFSKTFKNNHLFFQNIKRNISMVDKIKLETQKLDDLILENNIDIKKFNHWVIDVQGAELDVLKGSINSLKFCKSVVVEISTVKFYENASIFYDVKKLLNSLNFNNNKEPIRNHEDILFIKNN
jgi:FkbM family methyltransferase